MTPAELKIWDKVPIRIAIVDPYLSTIRATFGAVVYHLDTGSIPMEVRMNCDRPKDEPEFSG